MKKTSLLLGIIVFLTLLLAWQIKTNHDMRRALDHQHFALMESVFSSAVSIIDGLESCSVNANAESVGYIVDELNRLDGILNGTRFHTGLGGVDLTMLRFMTSFLTDARLYFGDHPVYGILQDNQVSANEMEYLRRFREKWYVLFGRLKAPAEQTPEYSPYTANDDMSYRELADCVRDFYKDWAADDAMLALLSQGQALRSQIWPQPPANSGFTVSEDGKSSTGWNGGWGSTAAPPELPGGSASGWASSDMRLPELP